MKLFIVGLSMKRKAETYSEETMHLAYHACENEDEALGYAVRTAKEKLPQFSVVQHSVFEISPEHIAMVADNKDQFK